MSSIYVLAYSYVASSKQRIKNSLEKLIQFLRKKTSCLSICDTIICGKILAAATAARPGCLPLIAIQELTEDGTRVIVESRILETDIKIKRL